MKRRREGKTLDFRRGKNRKREKKKQQHNRRERRKGEISGKSREKSVGWGMPPEKKHRGSSNTVSGAGSPTASKRGEGWGAACIRRDGGGGG